MESLSWATQNKVVTELNGCCLAYIGNTSNLDSSYYGGHCICLLAHDQIDTEILQL